MSKPFQWIHTSPERIDKVIKDIETGSDPRPAFYALMVAATLIASLGLLANSAAVIIGAMLVSPLMMPIFGIALGMLQGNTTLFWQALKAEGNGVVLAVAVSLLFALLPLSIEASPEMLARTEPTLLDLLVALLAGFAGTYAIVDERLSPALPGVAIATAIVPPLANTGLCLGLGAYTAAFGSFMLFVANFFAILVIGALTFTAAGMVRSFTAEPGKDVVRRFRLPVVGFVIVTVFLTHSLVTIVDERWTRQTVYSLITQHISRMPKVDLDDLEQQAIDDKVHVIATVRSPRVVPPEQVTALQNVLSEALGKPVELIIRTLFSRDVSAFGTYAQAAKPNLEGKLIRFDLPEEQQVEQMAEQVLREKLIEDQGFDLVEVRYGKTHGQPIIFAHVDSIRALSHEEIRELRDGIRERTGEPSLLLAVLNYKVEMMGGGERALWDWTNYGKVLQKDEELLHEIRQIVHQAVEQIPQMFPIGIHFRAVGKPWRILVEVVGPRAPTPSEVAEIQNTVSKRAPRPIEVSIWFRSDPVVTSEGYLAYRDFTKDVREGQVKRIDEMFMRRHEMPPKPRTQEP